MNMGAEQTASSNLEPVVTLFAVYFMCLGDTTNRLLEAVEMESKCFFILCTNNLPTACL